ncbi:MAG TPA: PH domain-containing protein [Actinotalea caeni]|uniref:PH domain-containing protein n=1 Tax=Actinotalea caeni TaxID=1348467 RepID=UPI0012E181BB|nr:PH domain-containing protein [Actinotalea caeni]HLV56510.1 PH domain-containing protein [Actinotalea caeni]
MALPRKFLGADEDVILHMRTHGKDLVLPALGLVVLAAATWAAMVFMPASWTPVGTWVVGVVVAVLFVVVVLVPFLRWRTTTYTLTDRRVITRRGIINKSGHDIPLSRINNVTYDRSLLDRILGCGTLELTTAAEAPVTLHDVPDVERVHVVMTELLFGDEQGAVLKANEDD